MRRSYSVCARRAVWSIICLLGSIAAQQVVHDQRGSQGSAATIILTQITGLFRVLSGTSVSLWTPILVMEAGDVHTELVCEICLAISC